MSRTAWCGGVVGDSWTIVGSSGCWWTGSIYWWPVPGVTITWVLRPGGPGVVDTRTLGVAVTRASIATGKIHRRRVSQDTRGGLELIVRSGSSRGQEMWSVVHYIPMIRPGHLDSFFEINHKQKQRSRWLLFAFMVITRVRPSRSLFRVDLLLRDIINWFSLLRTGGEFNYPKIVIISDQFGKEDEISLRRRLSFFPGSLMRSRSCVSFAPRAKSWPFSRGMES